MNVEKRRKRRIRNLICIQYSVIKLLLVVACFELLGGALQRMGETEPVLAIQGELVPADETQEEYI